MTQTPVVTPALKLSLGRELGVPGLDALLAGFVACDLNFTALFAGGSAPLTVGAPTAGFSPGDLVISGAGNLVSKLTPGAGVSAALVNSAGVSGGVALSNDARFTGLAGPQTKNTNYTFVAADVGGLFRHTDSSSYTWTIDTHANAAIAAGQTIVGTCEGTGTLSIAAPSGGSLIRLDGTAGTGNRMVGAPSMFTLINLDGADAWGISGSALS